MNDFNNLGHHPIKAKGKRMTSDSTQHKLDRVRPPRVQITYDVETGGAIQLKELPLVVGILADLAGQQDVPLGPLKERKFVEIDRDNFNDVLASLRPQLVEHILGQDGAKQKVVLSFKRLDDFHPQQVVRQVAPLNQLLEARKRLVDLLAKLDGNDVLVKLLQEALKDEAGQRALKAEVEASPPRLPDAASTPAKAGAPTAPAPAATPTTPASAAPPTAPAPAGAPTSPTATPPTPASATTATATAPATVGGSSLLVRIFTEGKLIRDPSQTPRARELVGELVNGVVDKTMPVKPNLTEMINYRVAQIDEAIGKQLNAVLHSEGFQKLEGAWRGLHSLVMNSETGTQLKLRVLHATQKELLEDLENATEFDQSALFKKVYEEEYGTFGGAPFGLLVGDYEFGRHPQDLALLEKLSNVAAAAHAPFISGASPKLFDLDSFTELSGPRDLAKIFESSELASWRSFRDSEDSRYVTLALPRVLLRLPYGSKTVPVEGFVFEEDVDGTDSRRYLWGNAAYALGQRITNAFATYHWCAAIRGVEGGGMVKGLPLHTFKTADGETVMKCPTEVALTDRREKELSDLGFLALVHSKGTDFAAFFGSQTVQKPKVYDTPRANANARLSAQLPYVLATARFAHYLKSMMRDKIGSFMTRETASTFLNRWISNYVQLNDEAAADIKARQPLREARIDVFDLPGKPGAFKAVVFLRPHFQLNELTASIRLVADLPKPAA